MKKLLVTGAAVAMLVASIAPAFAKNSLESVAIVKGNGVTVSANTGLNCQSSGVTEAYKGGSVVGGGSIMVTGNVTASGYQLIGANISLGHGEGDSLAVVKANKVSVSGNTGLNHQTSGETEAYKGGSVVGGGSQLQTGNILTHGGQLVVTNVSLSH